MTAHSHRFVLPRADEFARRPGDETHPLARNHGPDWRAILQIEDRPYAEQDEGDFYAFFGSEPFDAAPDLTTAAHERAVSLMPGSAGL